jgi:fructose transport system ATP-binding protein
MKDEYILQVRGISKHFGGVVALKNVDLELRKGEILAIVGDNGAGKSTLIKILTGVYQKDSGEIYFDGKKVKIENPLDAKNLGIETVYQDLALVDQLDVPSNIFLGRWIRRKDILGKFLRYIDHKKMYDKSLELIEKLGINIKEIGKPMLNYSGGQRQAVALSRIIYWGKKIAILDEPTAALGVRESKKALELIGTLKDHGLSVIIISHNLQHVFNIVDRIMILRQGERVGVKEVHKTNADEIVSMITGSIYVEKV